MVPAKENGYMMVPKRGYVLAVASEYRPGTELNMKKIYRQSAAEMATAWLLKHGGGVIINYAGEGMPVVANDMGS